MHPTEMIVLGKGIVTIQNCRPTEEKIREDQRDCPILASQHEGYKNECDNMENWLWRCKKVYHCSEVKLLFTCKKLRLTIIRSKKAYFCSFLKKSKNLLLTEAEKKLASCQKLYYEIY